LSQTLSKDRRCFDKAKFRVFKRNDFRQSAQSAARHDSAEFRGDPTPSGRVRVDHRDENGRCCDCAL
jgi:hypothetical protein